MARYGWVSKHDSLMSYLDYNRMRREFSHRWSAKSIGEMFGYREYDKIIPLANFVKTPINVLEDLLEGVAFGTEKIKKAIAASKGKKDPDPMKLINDELNKNL